MKVKNYSYDSFPAYDQYIEGIIDVSGKKDNLRCRMVDVEYQKDCIIRFLFPNTILEEERKYPLIIHVQGSGWYAQDMNDHIFDFMPIVKRGYAYAIIQHHGSPEFKIPKQLEDIKLAIQFIKKYDCDYPIDIHRCYLSGDSSGAHLALLTLLNNDSSIKFDGFIDLYGPVNFLTLDKWWSKYDWEEEKNIEDALGKENLNEDTLKMYSPYYYIHDDMRLPPILILHGSKDHVIPFSQSVELYNQLKAYDYDVTFIRVNGADHGRSIFYVKDVYDCMIEFLEKCIKF